MSGNAVVRIVAALMTVAMLLTLSACGAQQDLNFYDAETVMINGRSVDDLPIQLNRENNAHIPLIGLLQALGFQIRWKSENTATVSIKEKEYIISVKDETVFRSDRTDNFNYLTPAPGNDYYFCEAAENDIIVDDDTARVFLGEAGVRCSVTVDYKKMTVSIETPDP